MSVHSLDWDEILERSHVPKAALSSSASSAPSPSLHGSPGPEPPNELKLTWDEEPDSSSSAISNSSSSSHASLAYHFNLSEKEDNDSHSDQDQEPDQDQDHQPHPYLRPTSYGDLYVDPKTYTFDWGEKPREQQSPPGSSNLGSTRSNYRYDRIPPNPTPSFRQEDMITQMPEYKVLRDYLDGAELLANHKHLQSKLVRRTAYAIQEATYYVLGLSHWKKLTPFQTQVLLWKHVSNLYRACYHFATETKQYKHLVDLLVEFQVDGVEVKHPHTNKTVQYEDVYDGHISNFWLDLPGIQSAIRDELNFISHNLGEGDAGALPDKRREHLRPVIEFTCELITRCNINLPYQGRGNKSTYLEAGKWFRAAFGRLIGWDWPVQIEPNAGLPPKPNEWEIQAACYWMIGLAKTLRQQIGYNEEEIVKNPALKDDPWFPPWDYGVEDVFHYPGSEIWVDRNTDPEAEWDSDLWREWSKAKGLNEFTQRGWDAWGKGFIAVLDANRRGNYDVFVGGKKLSDETEVLVQQALNSMVRADEDFQGYLKFAEEVEVMSL